MTEEPADRHFPGVQAVDHYPAFQIASVEMGCQSGGQTAEGGFAAAAGPGYQHIFPLRYGEVDLGESPVLHSFITIRDIFESQEHL